MSFSYRFRLIFLPGVMIFIAFTEAFELFSLISLALPLKLLSLRLLLLILLLELLLALLINREIMFNTLNKNAIN